MLHKIKNFLRADFRWKLKKISSITKIKFYLDYFPLSGIKGIYTKLILNLIFFEKALVKRKLILDNIKKNTSVQKNKKINFLVSSPGSGSNYLRCMLSSYFEIFYKIGNGIPKFDNIFNKWIYSASPLIAADLHNAVDLEETPLMDAQKRTDNSKLFFSDTEYQEMKVVFTRHPFSNANLFKLEDMRPMVLVREPLDWLFSYYTHHKDRKYDFEDKINKQLICESLDKLKDYYLFWIKFAKDKSKNVDYKIVEFKSLSNNPEVIFKKICVFFGYKNINNDIIKRCAEINSKDFSLKHINTSFEGSRFTNKEKKQQTIDTIRIFSEEEIKKRDLNKIFEDLLALI
jgi:hypothetical protein